MRTVAGDRLKVATLDLEPFERPPLRLVASIVLAEVARQVGRRRPIPGEPAPRRPVYEATLNLESSGDMRVVDPEELLAY